MGRKLEEWHQFEEGIIVRVDIESKSGTIVKRYVSPPEVLPEGPNPSIIFKAGSVRGEILYACTQTEVIGFDIRTFATRHYLSRPEFNDVHHVAALEDGSLAVVSTGLDAVFQLNLQGELIREWSTVDQAIWDRFDHGTDYRRVVTTKPHLSHPNYCFAFEGDLWATRFEQRDAIRLSDPQDRFTIAIERPHDGLLSNGKLLFTTVDGHIVIFESRTRAIAGIVDLNEIRRGNTALGWCRGLLMFGDIALVGFTRIRRTRFREATSWLRRHVSRPGQSNDTLPTRIAAYDLRKRELLWEIPLEQYFLNAVFSMHVLPGTTRD